MRQRERSGSREGGVRIFGDVLGGEEDGAGDEGAEGGGMSGGGGGGDGASGGHVSDGGRGEGGGAGGSGGRAGAGVGGASNFVRNPFLPRLILINNSFALMSCRSLSLSLPPYLSHPLHHFWRPSSCEISFSGP